MFGSLIQIIRPDSSDTVFHLRSPFSTNNAHSTKSKFYSLNSVAAFVLLAVVISGTIGINNLVNRQSVITPNSQAVLLPGRTP